MKPLISIGQIIDHTWDHYKENFGELFMVNAWLFVIAALNVVAYIFYPLLRLPGTTQALTSPETFGVVLNVITFILIAPVIGVWVFNMTIRIIDRQQLKKKTAFKTISKEGWKYFFSNIWIKILYGLIVFAGLIVLVVPGVIFAIWFFFAIYAMLVDGKRGREALKYSKRLISGRWWGVVWRLIIPKILFLFVSFVISKILLIVIDLLVTGLLSVSVELAATMHVSLQTLLAVGLLVIFNPLLATADYILYTNLKLTKE